MLAIQRAEALRAEAAGEMGRRSLTAAQGLLQHARELDPDNPDLKKFLDAQPATLFRLTGK